MPYVANPGRLPPDCVIRDPAGWVTGYRNVHVRLFGGFDSRKAGHQPWPAFGAKRPTDWTISPTPHPFQIEAYEVA